MSHLNSARCTATSARRMLRNPFGLLAIVILAIIVLGGHLRPAAHLL